MSDPTLTTTWQPHVPPKWKLRARLWICAMFLLLAGADFLLWKFTSDPGNPVVSMTAMGPLLNALAVLAALGSTMLLICLWCRLVWSRYALGTLLSLSIAGFSMTMIFIVGNSMPRPAGLLKKPIVAVALQVLALVPLAKSRSIRKQLHPMTGRN